MNEKTTETIVSRRKALQVIGVGVIAPTVLAACQEGGEAPAKKATPEKKSGPATAKAEAKPEETKTAMAEGDKAAAGGEQSCDDSSKIDAQSAQMRKTLQYVEQSKQEGKQCNNCMQWIEAEKEGGCGGCKLFSGPVNPKGYCLSYAPKQA